MTMAAKVTAQDIADAGFRAEQFGSPLDGPGWVGGEYLGRLLGRVEQWARGRVGEVYDAIAVDTPRGEMLRSAELAWASAELWLRRAAFIDSNAVSSLDKLAYQDRREFEAQADRARERAEELMQQVADPDAPVGSVIGIAAAERGPWLRGRLS